MKCLSTNKPLLLSVIVTLLLGLVGVTGCGDVDTESTTNKQDLVAPVVNLNPDHDADLAEPPQESPARTLTMGSSAPVVDLSVTATPEQVVEHFLAALQQGSDEEVTGLLTAKARNETAKHDLVVRSPGSPTAEFSVGELELVSGGAYVNSQWSDTSRDGFTHSFEIIWVLRKQANGWRIAGMATRVAENEQPTYLNFENPREMIRKWNAADKRLTNKENPASPDSTTASTNGM
ncbi:MAG: hypothetical protein HOB73_07550 [Planctomycetaceae bacterium]|jgi:hypothetical protein|nr:hypothetical protein [Planctomycetaceae bacterium]